MEDRGLLELAAKAAVSAGINVTNHHGIWYDSDYDIEWNPLTDDGDALRLAVKLKMQIQVEDAWVRIWNVFVGTFPVIEHIGTGRNPEEATRRAIVRAAAEIGKQSH